MLDKKSEQIRITIAFAHHVISFRQSFATHFLEGGMDLRYI
ncbi:MAG: hypothetical protein PHE70_03125 [Tepidanaerobacteraceae bacterium]|nr:hypothetical protein [Tepidanaerobacteraceae bacterium]